MSLPIDPEAAESTGGAAQPVHAAVPPAAQAPPRPRFRFVRDMMRNVAAALALGLLRRRSLEAWRADVAQLIGLFALNLAAGLAYDIYAAYPGPGRFDWDALPAATFWALPMLLSAWVIAHMAREPGADRRVLPMAV